MTCHPRSLSIQEPHPNCTIWRCRDHGDLPPGEVECIQCEPVSIDRPHR